MSASAPRGRSLSRPGARNLSLSLVQHPLYRFRTYGAYGPSASATPMTSTPNDTELVDSDDMAVASACPRINSKHALPSAHTPASACKRGTDLTPFTAMTVDSAYSQDSWIEQEDAYTDSAQRVVHLRVDTRRFAVALSPGIDFIFPSAFASPSSATTGTFVAAPEEAIEAEASLPPSPAAEPRRDPEMLPRSMMATDAPVIPDASKPNGETTAETQAPLIGRTIKRPPSMVRLRAKKLGRILSRVNIISFSGNKRHKEVQVPLPDQTRNEHPVSQPSPHDSLESDFVLDLRNDGGSITSTEASDGILSPKQLDILLQQEASTQTFQSRPASLLCSVCLPSSIDFHDSLLPPISPLAVTFDKAMNWASQECVDPYAPTQCDSVMELIGIAI